MDYCAFLFEFTKKTYYLYLFSNTSRFRAFYAAGSATLSAIKEWLRMRQFSLSEKTGVDKGPQPLILNPALTACVSEWMKARRFSRFAGFTARERMR